MSVLTVRCGTRRAVSSPARNTAAQGAGLQHHADGRGGARGLHHFTEVVGGDVHITIDWSMAQDLIQSDRPVDSRIDAETPQSVIDELCEKFVDFCKAYDQDGLAVEEFAGYGPVQLFKNAFLKGYYLLLAEIASRRNALAL